MQLHTGKAHTHSSSSSHLQHHVSGAKDLTFEVSLGEESPQNKRDLISNDFSLVNTFLPWGMRVRYPRCKSIIKWWYGISSGLGFQCRQA